MEKPDISIIKLDSYESFRQHADGMLPELENRNKFETDLISDPGLHTVRGFCYVCRQKVLFSFDYLYSYEIKGVVTPNWRERLICPVCFLNSRMRSSIHLFEYLLNPEKENSIIYISEQVSPLYSWLFRNYANVTGSEFFGEYFPSGTSRHGIRNEDITSLSFSDDTFDYILSFDIFEHIPNVQKAFGECFRVLKPGGSLFFTVPFERNSGKNITLAVRNADNKVEHLALPEFHANPVDAEKGSLVFHKFGWEMLNQAKESGFQHVNAYLFWSSEFCYLGNEQIVFIAQKSA